MPACVCMCACVRACMHVCVRACVCVCVLSMTSAFVTFYFTFSQRSQLLPVTVSLFQFITSASAHFHTQVLTMFFFFLQPAVPKLT